MAKPKNPDFQTVITIRRLYESGELTQAMLGERFGLSQSTISKIINNDTHGDIFAIRFGGEALVKVGYKHGN